jgi:PAS domain S-box-containing protein
VIHKNILSAIGTAYYLLQQKGLLKETVQQILGLLGEATEVDRIYIFQNGFSQEHEFCMNYKFEWVAPGVSPQLDFSVLQNLPWAVFPEIESELRLNKPINDFVSNSKNEFFYETMVEQGIKSYCFVPIIANNLFWGFIGFDNCTTDNLFSEAQIAALHAFASTLGTAILAKRRRNSLVKSRLKYYQLINSLDDVVFNLNKLGQITFVNKPWEAFMGSDPKSVITYSIFDFVSSKHQDEVMDILHELQTNPNLKIEQEIILKNREGHEFWVLAQFSKETLNGSKYSKGYTGVFKKIKQENLVYNVRQGDVHQDNPLESGKDVVYAFLMDTYEGIFVSENVSLLGMDKEDFSHVSSFLNRVHPEDLAVFKREMDQFPQKRIFDLDYRIINKRGEVIWVQDKAWIERDRKGRDFKMFGRIADVTELKEKEIQLKASEERFRSITENIPLPLFICNQETGNLVYANQKFLDLLPGLTLETIIGAQLDKLIETTEGNTICDLLEEGTKVSEVEVKVEIEKGLEIQRVFSLSAHLIPFDGIDMPVGILYDITQRKENEARIKELNELLQAVNETQLSFFEQEDFNTPLNKLLDTILEITGSNMGFAGEVLYDNDNQPYLKSHTFSIKKKTDADEQFIQDNYKADIEFRNLETLFGATLKSGKVIISNDVPLDSRRGGTPKGHPHIHNYIGIPVFKGKEFLGMMGFANKDKPYSLFDVEFLMPIISGYANFIKAVRINRERKNSDSMYRLLSENTGDIISLHNLDSSFRYVSPSVEKVLGYKPEEIVGKKPSEIFGVQDLPELHEGIDTNIVVHKAKSKKKQVYLEIIRKIIPDAEGKPSAFLATSRDVTDRENVLEDLKKSLTKEKELSNLKSRFISMISHEFRTPLATIQSSTELINMIMQNSANELATSKINTHVDRINSQMKRLTGVISDILILEKHTQEKGQFKKEPVLIKKFITNLVENSFLEKDKNQLISLKLPEEERVIYSDQVWLTHIVKNIVENAIKYSTLNREIPVLELSYKQANFQIVVSDTGIGIPKEDQKNIFLSFFRAKNVSNIKGTGLGLSIVKEFIDRLGGTIAFKSFEGKGSTFTLTFPYDNKNPSD